MLQASVLGQGGEIFVLDMGQSVKILHLAQQMIKLSGFAPGDDIEIKVTGTRPGEKLFEELALEEEGAERTRHPKVFIGQIKPHPWEAVLEFVRELEGVSQCPDPEVIRGVFQRFITEYRPATARPPASVSQASPAPKLPEAAASRPSASTRAAPLVDQSILEG